MGLGFYISVFELIAWGFLFFGFVLFFCIDRRGVSITMNNAKEFFCSYIVPYSRLIYYLTTLRVHIFSHLSYVRSGEHCLDSTKSESAKFEILSALLVFEVCVCAGLQFPSLPFFGVLCCISLHVGSVEDTFKLAKEQVCTLNLRSEGSFIVTPC